MNVRRYGSWAWKNCRLVGFAIFVVLIYSFSVLHRRIGDSSMSYSSWYRMYEADIGAQAKPHLQEKGLYKKPNIQNNNNNVDIHHESRHLQEQQTPKPTVKTTTPTIEESESSRSLRFRTQTVTRVVYNRVPKCGSQTVNNVIKDLSKKHGFHVWSSRVYLNMSINEVGQKRMIQNVMRAKSPMLFDRHVYFTDFTKFGYEQPIYINVIRDPIDRLASWYYFIRFQGGHKRKMSDARRKMTYDECVAKKDEECTNTAIFSLVPYFCGQDALCSNATDAALNQAIKNVEKYFAVVGVTEDLLAFFMAAQYLLPNYFTGAADYYEAYEAKMKNAYHTSKKSPIKQETRSLMKKRLKHEYMFYYYIKQRFYKLLYIIQREEFIA